MNTQGSRRVQVDGVLLLDKPRGPTSNDALMRARRLLNAPTGRYVTIELTDTGQGMDAETLKRAFEPFFTTRADSGGTGLGLGLCRMLLSEMDGSIEVRSKVGQGTTFQITLTAIDAEEKG